MRTELPYAKMSGKYCKNLSRHAVFRIRTVCFRASWIRGSTNKPKMKENLDFYYYVTSFWLFIFDE
jgi:hypothetical protein